MCGDNKELGGIALRDETMTLAEMEEALDELHGCMIRRPGDCCEVRKEFLVIALRVLDAAVKELGCPK